MASDKTAMINAYGSYWPTHVDVEKEYATLLEEFEAAVVKPKVGGDRSRALLAIIEKTGELEATINEGLTEAQGELATTTEKLDNLGFEEAVLVSTKYTDLLHRKRQSFNSVKLATTDLGKVLAIQRRAHEIRNQIS